jgi:hypothetical protein
MLERRTVRFRAMREAAEARSIGAEAALVLARATYREARRVALAAALEVVRVRAVEEVRGEWYRLAAGRLAEREEGEALALARTAGA